jgi:hypothetical protein
MVLLLVVDERTRTRRRKGKEEANGNWCPLISLFFSLLPWSFIILPGPLKATNEGGVMQCKPGR